MSVTSFQVGFFKFWLKLARSWNLKTGVPAASVILGTGLSCIVPSTATQFSSLVHLPPVDDRAQAVSVSSVLLHCLPSPCKICG